jgi:hypothetical protein
MQEMFLDYTVPQPRLRWLLLQLLGPELLAMHSQKFLVTSVYHERIAAQGPTFSTTANLSRWETATDVRLRHCDIRVGTSLIQTVALLVRLVCEFAMRPTRI